MLMMDKIRKHRYFQAMRMKNAPMLDALTGTLSRTISIQYIQYLIKNNIRFTMGIIDIDNFKRVNDTFGHQIGDEILISMSKTIMESLPEDAILGRYGGDEFIVVYEGECQYEVLSVSLENIYDNIRKPMLISTGTHYHGTVTTGLCRFPKNGKNFDELFLLCDKCLYLGKQKGRNCYTIYVDYLHKNIEVLKKDKKSIAERIMELYQLFDQSDKKEKIYRGMELLTKDINMTGMAYFYKNKIRVSYEKNEEYGLPSAIPEIFLGDLEYRDYIRVDDYSVFEHALPELYAFCNENNLLSFIVYRVMYSEKNYGYVLIYDSDFKRVWQEDDMALLTILVKTLGVVAHFGNI